MSDELDQDVIDAYEEWAAEQLSEDNETSQ